MSEVRPKLCARCDDAGEMPKETKRALERMVGSVRRAVMLTKAHVDPAYAMAVVITDMVDTLRVMGYPEESIRGLFDA